jgi:hypothetical protein
MTRHDATNLIDSYIAPEGMLAVGSAVSYEDMANPRRMATVLGYRTTRWGTDAVLAFEVFEGEEDQRFDFITARHLIDGGRWRVEFAA